MGAECSVKSTPKHRIVTRILAFILVAATLALPALAQAPAKPGTDEEMITVNFVNADIQAVIKAIGQHTNKAFILDPRVQGTVNIVSDRPVSKNILYQMLLSTLRVQGYAAVEDGAFIKIVPEAEAKTSAGPTGEAAVRVPGDRIVTQVFILQNENAVQLVPVLRPLVTANNVIAAYPNNNAIVITDYASNVNRIQRIIESIDRPSQGDVQILRMNNASAIDIAQTLQRVVPETAAPGNAPGTMPKVAIGLDTRTNSLVIRAESPGLMARVKALAVGLDTPGAAAGSIYTVPLRNAEASKIAETLRGLLSGQETTRTTTTTTTPAGSTATQQTTASTLSAASAAQPAPSSVIQAYPPTNTIIITAPEHVYRSLRTVIDALDQRRQQVYVEALIVEVSTGLAQEFGVQWNVGRNVGDNQTLFGGTNFSTTTGSNILSAALNPLNIGTGLNLGIIRGTIKVPGTDIEIANLQLLARALEGDSGANVLSTPNVLTLDNEEAKIVVGQNVPFVTGAYTPTSGSATNPFQTIERKDVGITLRVTPQISEGGVKLRIYQEVSNVTRDKALVQSADIITNRRTLESTVLVDSGQIVVLGGLIQDDQQSAQDKVPLLGDIPVVGRLFRYESRNRKRTNLMIFLRPVVLKDEKAAASLTADRYEYIRGLQQGENVKPMPPFETQQTQPLGK